MLNVSLKVRLKTFSSSIMISKEIKMAVMCSAMVQESVAYIMSTQIQLFLFVLQQPTHEEEITSFLLSQKQENFQSAGIYLFYMLYSTSTLVHAILYIKILIIILIPALLQYHFFVYTDVLCIQMLANHNLEMCSALGLNENNFHLKNIF